MTHDEPTTRSTADPATLTIAGGATLAWYAVPDLVRPRWARALLKTAVATAGAVLTVTSTREGLEARKAVRSLRDEVRAAADGADAAGGTTTEPSGGTGDGVREDNTYLPDAPGAPPFPVAPAVLTAGAVGAVAASVALIVAGEKWAYRRGEAMRGRGLRLPHTRVGLAMGAVAVALAAAEPFLWKGEDAEPFLWKGEDAEPAT